MKITSLLSATLLGLLAVAVAPPPNVRAQGNTATLTTIHRFTGDDGAHPYAGLVQGRDGNFYGTTYNGRPDDFRGFVSTNNGGTIFKITPDGVLTTLHSTPSTTGGNAGGGNYERELIQGSDGNFYGTAPVGGANGYGTVFRMTPAGDVTTLFDFDTTGTPNGTVPESPLVQGRDGNFYGMTVSGGGPGAYYGTVFKITPGGALTTLYRFTGAADGLNPKGGLVLGSDGNFYGTTSDDGSRATFGTVFKITPEGVLTTLYRFRGGDDGDRPWAGLVEGRDGNFYGTTSGLATSGASNRSHYGTVFRITPAGVLTTLYSFTGRADDGTPFGALIQGSDGKFYGTTYGIETGYVGSIYSITSAGEFTTLYTFGSSNDGDRPQGSLVQAADGSFYGTTSSASGSSFGTVFRLTVTTTPSVQAPVITSAGSATGTVGQAFSFQLSATNSPTSYAISGLPQGLSLNATTGLISGTPTAAVTATLGVTATNSGGSGSGTLTITIAATPPASAHPAFYNGEMLLGNGVYYLAFTGTGNVFGYYAYLSDPHFIYHFDMGYLYWFDGQDAVGSIYFYDFTSDSFFYTSPSFGFPYLYDFKLNAFLYYYPDANNPGRYTQNPRYFYNFATGQVISK